MPRIRWCCRRACLRYDVAAVLFLLFIASSNVSGACRFELVCTWVLVLTASFGFTHIWLYDVAVAGVSGLIVAHTWSCSVFDVSMSFLQFLPSLQDVLIYRNCLLYGVWLISTLAHRKYCFVHKLTVIDDLSSVLVQSDADRLCGGSVCDGDRTRSSCWCDSRFSLAPLLVHLPDLSTVVGQYQTLGVVLVSPLWCFF